MESSKQPAGAGRYAVARLILLAIAWELGASGLVGSHPSSLDGAAPLTGSLEGGLSQVTGLVARRRVTTQPNEYFTIQNRFCANPCVTNTGDIFERDLSSSALGSEAAAYPAASNTPDVDYCYDGDTATSVFGADCAGAPGTGLLKGRLTQVKKGTVTVQYSSFDALGRVLAHSQTMGTTAYSFPAYAYDHLGLTSVTYPSGRILTFEPDSSGGRSTVSGTSGRYAKITSYAANGTPALVQLGGTAGGSGQVAEQVLSFNNRFQVTGVVARKVSTPAVQYFNIQNYFCANKANPCVTNTGDIFERDLSSSELGGEAAWSVSQSFRYDRLGRLTTFQENPGSTTTDVETSAYDQWGNRFVTQGATPGMGIPTAATAFDALNRMGSGYDDSGNLTSYSPVTLTYDAENRIVKAELVFNGTVTETTAYEYDGAGRRVKKTFTPTSGSAVTTSFVYDASGELAAEYGGPSSTMSGVRYVLSDHMGTTRALIASDGSVDKRYDFKPFGEEIGSGVRGRSAKYSSPSYPGVGDGFSQKFTGKERDAETGLDYFLARYYSGAHGRYLSPDWSDPPTPVPYADLDDPQTLNLYGYVRNSPLTNTDPDGHCFGPALVPCLVAGPATLTAGVAVARNPDKAIRALGAIGGAIAVGLAASGNAGTCNGIGCMAQEMGKYQMSRPKDDGTREQGDRGRAENKPSDEAPTSSGSDTPYQNTPQNQDRMEKGKAPVGKDGKPVELHHTDQGKGPLKEMTRTDHRLGGNFKKNHSNTGQKPSQIDRSKFKTEREQYWKDKANKQEP